MSEEDKKILGIKKTFYILLCIVAATCFVCAIVSTFSLTVEKILWEKSLEDASQSVSNCAVKVSNFIDNDAVETNAPAKTKKTTEAAASSEKGSQTDNGEQQSSLPTAKGAADYSEMQKIADKTVDYVERLQKVQENSSKNSIMSFIYAVLGAVLTAVGAALVGYVFRSKEMAQEARKDLKKAKKSAVSAVDGAEKAKNAADSAVKEANKAKDSAKSAVDEANKAKESAQSAVDEANKAKDFAQSAVNEANKSIEAEKAAVQKAKEAEESYKNQVVYQQNALNTQSILIKIAYAKFELIDFNKIDAGDHFKIIKEKIIEVNENYDNNLVEQLHNELCNLREYIEKYNDEDYVKEGLSKRIKDCDEGDIASFKKAIENYCNIIEEAIRRCEEILDNHAEDLIQ